MEKQKTKFFKTRKFVGIIVGIIAFIIGFLMGVSGNSQDPNLNTKLTQANSQIQKLKDENNTLQQKVKEAAPYFALQKDKQEEIAKEAKAKAAAQEKAAKEKAEKKAEEGYKTGVTYSELARTPDKYTDSKVEFSGQVIQVINSDDGSTQLRLAVNDNYDDVILVQYSNDIISERVLENDEITVMGESEGLITYQSTLGGNITIPSMIADKIVDKTNS